MTEKEEATWLASTLSSLEYLLSVCLRTETTLDHIYIHAIHPEKLAKDIKFMVSDCDEGVH